MSANPIELVGGLANTSDVVKADLIAWAKARVPQVMEDAAEINATNLAGQLIVMVNDLGTFYYLDSTDTTSADDPPEVIVSLDNKRFKPLSSVPLPTGGSLGGVFASAAVANQFLTGIGLDGHVTRVQPAAADLSDGLTGTGAVVRANSPALVTPTGIVKGDVGLGNVDNTSNATERAAARTLTNASISGSANTITNLTTAMFATNVVDTDGTLAANSDTRIASQKATKTYLDQIIAAADAMVFKGVIDCSANPNYPAADRGWTYKVSVAGKIGGASGTTVDVGDTLLCITDGTASGTQAAVGAQWNIVQANLVGAVTGPASSTSGNFASFNGTGGTVIQDSGKATPSGAVVGTSDTQTLTNKTLTNAVENGPDINGGTVDNITSFGIRSTGAAFDLQMASAEVFTGNRKLTWVLGNADRTLTLGGNTTLNGGTHSGTNTGDQTITLSGDISGTGTGSFTTAIGANKVTLGMMAQIATATFLGRTTASTGNVEALTVAQATALLNVMAGDSGSGGVKGLVPAQGAGDASAGKFLKADGTWAVPAGGGGGGGMTDAERQNFLLTTAYQSKSFASYRRLVNMFADGYKASDGINAGSSSNYSVNTSLGYVAPSTSADTWTNEVSQTFNANLTGFAGYADRQLLPAGAAANGDRIRLTLTPPTSGNNTNITDMFIGQGGTAPNYGGTPTRVTFNGGSSSVTLTAGGAAVVSDEITFSYNASLTTTVGILFSGAASDVRQLTGLGATYNAYQKAAASVSDINATTGSGFSSNSGFMQVVSKIEARTAVGSTNNMTVVTTAQTADAAVSNGRVLLEIDNIGSPTLNTDLTVEVTCNGGTNWATATLSSVTSYSQGGRKVVETADTACTSGTSFAARVKTLNNKNIPVYALGLTVH